MQLLVVIAFVAIFVQIVYSYHKLKVEAKEDQEIRDIGYKEDKDLIVLQLLSVLHHL